MLAAAPLAHMDVLILGPMALPLPTLVQVLLCLACVQSLGLSGSGGKHQPLTLFWNGISSGRPVILL